MAFKRPLPEWNNPGVEPPQSKKDMGWLGREKPPAQWHNWFQHLVFKALEELQQGAAHVTFGVTAPVSPDVNDLWVDTSGHPVFVLKAWDGAQWITVGAVSSVNGKTGDVELTAEDVGAASLTAFNTHLNDNERHVTQAEKNTWNNKISKSGDTMTGNLTIESGERPQLVFHYSVGSGTSIRGQILARNSTQNIWRLGGDSSNGDLILENFLNQFIRLRTIGLFLENITANLSAIIMLGTGSPEGNVPSPPGSLYLQTDSGRLWVKTGTSSGNTGWKEVQTV